MIGSRPLALIALLVAALVTPAIASIALASPTATESAPSISPSVIASGSSGVRLETRVRAFELGSGARVVGDSDAGDEGAWGIGAALRRKASECLLAARGSGVVARSVGGVHDLARFRSELGLAPGEGALARLDVGGRSFYGINCARPTSQLASQRHHENARRGGCVPAGSERWRQRGRGTLLVDRVLCVACGPNGGVRGLARQLGLEEVEVVTPLATQVIRP